MANKKIGMTHVTTFTRHTTTHLLCPSGTGAKFDKAKGETDCLTLFRAKRGLEWGVPVIDMSWLGTIVRTGAIPPTSVVALEKEMKMVEITNGDLFYEAICSYTNAFSRSTTDSNTNTVLPFTVTYENENIRASSHCCCLGLGGSSASY